MYILQDEISMSEETTYRVHLFVEYNVEAPLKLVMECDSDLRSEIGDNTDYQRVKKSAFEGNTIYIWKDMVWTSKFQLGWHKARLDKLLEKHKDIILRMNFDAYEIKTVSSEEELKEYAVEYDNRPKKLEEDHDKK
jgi:hypothetical protein